MTRDRRVRWHSAVCPEAKDEAALWAVHTTGNFRDALLLAVNLGEDADTVGTVAGQLAGARYGLRGISPDWLAKLAWKKRIAISNRRVLAEV